MQLSFYANEKSFEFKFICFVFLFLKLTTLPLSENSLKILGRVIQKDFKI